MDIIARRKIYKILGLILILISLFYFIIKFYLYFKIIKAKNEEMSVFFKQYNNIGNKIELNHNVTDYLLVLEIPKINLKQGVYNKYDYRNNIDKNVSILVESIRVNSENSLLLLAAHSGNSFYSYFKDLNKLKLKDQIIIYYENEKYIYKVINIYNMPKSSELGMPEIKNNHLILITCLNDYTYLIIEAEDT